jgi:hypothetical protein
MMSDSNADLAIKLLEKHDFKLSLLESKYLDLVLSATLVNVEFKEATGRELGSIIKNLQTRLHEFSIIYSSNKKISTSSSTSVPPFSECLKKKSRE